MGARYRVKKLLWGVLLSAAPLLLHGAETVTYRSGYGVSLHCSETLRQLERFLKELFPKSPYRKTPLTIDITGALPLPAPPAGKRIELKSTDLEHLSLEILSEAGGAMLHAYGKAPENFRLPLFLCAAFRHRERSLKQEGRFLGNNRQLNSVRASLYADATPPLKEIFALKAPDSDPAAAAWFDDHSRLLFELLRRKGFRGSASELENAAKKLLQSPLKEEISLHFWNNFQLLPPHLIRKELDQLMQVRLPRLDHNGEVNGLFETVAATQMPAKLRLHPQRQELFRDYAALVLTVSARCPRFMRVSLRHLHESTNALGKNPAPELETGFLQALADVEQAFLLCRRRSQALDEAALQMSNPVRLLRRPLLENSRPCRAASPEAERFLQRWNDYYNSN